MGTSQVPLVLKLARPIDMARALSQSKPTDWIDSDLQIRGIQEKQCPGYIYGQISKSRVPFTFPWSRKNFKIIMLPIFDKRNWKR